MDRTAENSILHIYPENDHDHNQDREIKNKNNNINIDQNDWSNLMFKIDNEHVEIEKQFLVKKIDEDSSEQLQFYEKNMCEFCKIPLIIDSDCNMFCNKCGIEIKDKFGSANDNETKQPFIQMKINDGNKRNQHQKSLFRSTANYEQYQNKRTLDGFKQVCSQGCNGKYIAPNILNDANKLFQKIRSAKFQVFRKQVKLGIMSACVSYVMAKHGESKPPTEISQQFGIEHKFHSRGDTLIHQMIDQGIIEPNSHSNIIVDYIKMYVELLKIDPKYCKFIFEIIEKAEEKLLHVLFDSKNNTKCIGTIWFLIERLKLPITKDYIAKVCEISKTTFIKYYTLIVTFYKLFIPIFIKYKIPLKTEWKRYVYLYFGKEIQEQKKQFTNTNVISVPIAKKSTRKRNITMNFGIISPKISTPSRATINQTPISIISGLSRRSSISSNASVTTFASETTFDFKTKRKYVKKNEKKIIILDDDQEYDNTESINNRLNGKLNSKSINVTTISNTSSPATTLSPDSPMLY
jgi:transcription initiation factor TFIIIB Brf1 subunit/transcription initiation factor TFIIB